MKAVKAAVLYEPKTPLKIETVEYRDPEPGQVLVRLMASGVCHSDRDVIKGEWPWIPLPTVLGHEGAGIVEAVGAGTSGVCVGDHVVLAWRNGCGVCEMCQQGFLVLCEAPQTDPRACPTAPDGETLNKMGGLGTFATHTVVPRGNVVVIDREIPFSQASLLGCAVMTGIGAAINTARVRPGCSVAVFGCGGVGLNCIQGAALAGADPIIAVDVIDDKLSRAKLFGATHTVNSRHADPVKEIIGITGGRGAHFAFEAIGLSAEPFVQSILCTRRRGVTVFVGHAPDDLMVTMKANILMQEKSVMASMYGSARPQVDFPRLASLYNAGKLKLDELVTREYPLEQINEAFEAMARNEVARSVIRFS